MIDEITEEQWKVVHKRVESASSTLRIGILGEILTKEDVLKAIEGRTPEGRAVALAHIEYLRWCAKGR